jgi:hypothetical protein
MRRGVDPYAFSRVDMGAQLAWRIWRVRPYVSAWLKNSRTAEIERDTLTFRAPVGGRNSWPVNYVDPSGNTTATFGIEIPCTKEGRGLDIHFTPVSGRFRYIEFRKDTSTVTHLGYRGWALSLGWSGPFTGAGLPWR